MTAVTADWFREVLGHVPTGVTVIAALALARVVAIDAGPARGPLVFHRGNFGALSLA
jgi:hypothetical protein